ncbi:hypothetical protein Q8F55_004520 [Vanrija albida]|uniref:Uncharacterized protein n=1 Tax=Vanrija albida TaxID=181172 RepID=A0ABR3Q7L5_9TREE
MPSHQPAYCDSGLGQPGPVVHHPIPHHYQPKNQHQHESPCPDLLPLQGHPTPYAQYAELPLVDDYGFYYEPLTVASSAIPIPQPNKQSSSPCTLGLNNSLGLSNVPAPTAESPITVDLEAFTAYEANLHSYHHDMLNAWLDCPETAREHTSPPPPPTPTMGYLELDDDDDDLDIVSGGVRLLAL